MSACKRSKCVTLSRPTKGVAPGARAPSLASARTRDRMRLPPLLSGLPARVRHREVECQTAVTAKRKFKAAAHRLAVRLAMPPVDVSSQNLRERSLQVSAPRVPAGGVHGEKKRIRSLDVLGHRARHLEHRAAVPDALDLADVAALRFCHSVSDACTVAPTQRISFRESKPLRALLRFFFLM